MPFAAVNGIDVHYRLAGDGPETIVLVNGLADDLETWAYQEAALTAAGYRLLMFDNRGIGQTSKPAGPYSSRLLADDAKALVDHLGITDFHLLGRVHGRHDRPGVRAGLPRGPPVGDHGLHLRGARAVLLADVRHVGRRGAGARHPVRDARRHAVGVHHGFFSSRPGELAEFETAMRYMDQPVPAYLAQLAVIQQHDTTGAAGRDHHARPWSWPGSRTSSSRSRCPGNCTRGSPARSGRPSRAATPACGSTPPASTTPSLDFVRRHGKGD